MNSQEERPNALPRDALPEAGVSNGAIGRAIGGELWPPRSFWLDLLARYSPIRLSGPIILMYHQVTVLETDHWSLAVSPRHFAEHLDVLSRRRHPVSLRRLTEELASKRLDDRQVVVTFDDGYADNLTNAKPLLEQFGIPATVFVVGDAVGQMRELWWDELDSVFQGRHPLPETLQLHVDGRDYRWELREGQRIGIFGGRARVSRERLRRLLWQKLRALPADERRRAIEHLQTWADRPTRVRPERRVMTERELLDLGRGGLIEIGAHTASHPRLSALSPTEQAADIARGKLRLEEIIGSPVTSFSYPFGGHLDVSSVTVTAVREAGFERACTTNRGTVQLTTDPFRLPRLYVGDWTGDEFERRLAPWL